MGPWTRVQPSAIALPKSSLATASFFFHSFASAESAVLRAVVSLVTPLVRVRR